MKRLYRLAPKTKMLTNFYVFDTETADFENGWYQWKLKARPESFQLGVIYGYNYTKVIHDRKEMILTLQNKRFAGAYMFAHNAEYDLTVLYDNLYKFDPEAIFNGRFIAATNGNCFFADSMNIFKTSAAVIGEMLGIKKLKLGNSKLRTRTVDKGVINRCIVDCQIIWEALFTIFQEAGDIKITQASLSLIYYRRFHQPYHIDFDEKNIGAFWDSYYGGRTEVFKIGPTHASVIDLNSAYPYAMKHVKFPNPKYLKVEKKITTDYLVNHLFPHYEGCVYATVHHKQTWIGYLPLKQDGKLLFPTGDFTGCWNFNELKFAMEQGVVTIKRITKVVYADRMPSPFESYVDHLYAKRMASKNEFEIYRIKIFMNSLYGKFAQRIQEESIYIDDIKKRIDLIKDHQKKGTFIALQLFNPKRNDAFLVTCSKKGQHVSHSIPSFASYITSFTRVMVLKQLLKMKSAKPVYCDTDSIFYEGAAVGFKNSFELGGWKKEAKTVYQVDGLKNYHYKDHKKEDLMIHRIKGVPKKATKIEENVFEYFDLMKTKEALRRGLTAGVLTKRKKVITGKYDKRLVLSNGKTITVDLDLDEVWDE